MPKDDKKDDKGAIASDKENAKLEHTQGGVTTRDDATDLGVPMLPGDASEPVGPEDALGPGPKRGDYRGRLGNTTPHEIVRVPDAKPGEPVAKVVDQAPRAADIGDAKGKKGGVGTAEQ